MSFLLRLPQQVLQMFRRRVKPVAERLDLGDLSRDRDLGPGNPFAALAARRAFRVIAGGKGRVHAR